MLVELAPVGGGGVLPFVVPALEPVHVGPLCRARVVHAEEIVGGRQPLVEVFLQQPDGDLARSDNALDAVVAGAEMEGLLLQHGRHAPREGGEGRAREHLELELAVPVDELGEDEEIDPVVDVLVERPEQPAPLERPAFQELLRLPPAGLAELVDEEVRHLVAVAHLLPVHAGERLEVVVGGRRIVEGPLLLDRGELGVALDRDQVFAGVPDALVRDLEHGLPLARAPEVAELDLGLGIVEARLEPVLAHVLAHHPDLALPGLEVVGPVLPGRDLDGHVTSP